MSERRRRGAVHESGVGRRESAADPAAWTSTLPPRASAAATVRSPVRRVRRQRGVRYAAARRHVAWARGRPDSRHRYVAMASASQICRGSRLVPTPAQEVGTRSSHVIPTVSAAADVMFGVSGSCDLLVALPWPVGRVLAPARQHGCTPRTPVANRGMHRLGLNLRRPQNRGGKANKTRGSANFMIRRTDERRCGFESPYGRGDSARRLRKWRLSAGQGTDAGRHEGSTSRRIPSNMGTRDDRR
jgi:hypothetical protein